jgi:hypothetical protein
MIIVIHDGETNIVFFSFNENSNHTTNKRNDHDEKKSLDVATEKKKRNIQRSHFFPEATFLSAPIKKKNTRARFIAILYSFRIK